MIRARIERAEGVPGLFNAYLEDGRELLDLTTAQMREVIVRERLIPFDSPAQDVGRET